jgi:long-chain fatty acid transport protein
MRFRLLFIPVVFSGLTATAGGFDTGPQGARILGLGGASTAYIGSIAGLSTNPGLLGQWADSLTRVSIGGIGQMRRSSFIGKDTYQRTDQDLAVQPGGYFYATHGVSSRIAVGLSITTPYGYHTRWPDNWEGRSVVRESQLNTYFAQPTVAIRLNDNFSAGVGFVYAFGKYSHSRALGQYDNPAAEARFSGTGSGFGATAGLYGRAGDNLAFGISYRSGVKLAINKGTVDYTGILERDAALYPASTSFKTDVNLPSTLSVGLSDHINKNLLLTFDFQLSGWSTLDSLNLDVAANGPAKAQRVLDGRRYEDALAFRIGAEYQASPALVLLAGLHYDETPVRDEYINPIYPDANLLGVSAGISYQLSSRLGVEAGYSFDYGQLRTARAKASDDLVSNVSGTYRTMNSTVSLGVSAAF